MGLVCVSKTTLRARVVEVGEWPDGHFARLIVAERRLILPVERDMARELARKLYEDVELEIELTLQVGR